MQLPVKVTRAAGRAGLVLKKHAPDILFGFGLAGMVGATVLAVKAARKHDEVAEEVSDKLTNGMVNILDQNLTENQAKQQIGQLYIGVGLDWVKLYGPAISLGIASITSLIVGHKITKERMASVMAAYTLLERSYSQYRARVIEKLGEEQDDEFRFGDPEKRSIDVVDENGKKKKVKYEVYKDASDYTAFFDEGSLQWRNEPQMNMAFLKAQQSHLNDMLNINGHVFLNEVWDALGIPRTRAGAVVGWVKHGTGDGIIDLGLYSTKNASFVNGREPSCMIDPNVDGVIYDLL